MLKFELKHRKRLRLITAGQNMCTSGDQHFLGFCVTLLDLPEVTLKSPQLSAVNLKCLPFSL